MKRMGLYLGEKEEGFSLVQSNNKGCGLKLGSQMVVRKLGVFVLFFCMATGVASSQYYSYSVSSHGGWTPSDGKVETFIYAFDDFLISSELYLYDEQEWDVASYLTLRINHKVVGTYSFEPYYHPDLGLYFVDIQMDWASVDFGFDDTATFELTGYVDNLSQHYECKIQGTLVRY